MKAADWDAKYAARTRLWAVEPPEQFRAAVPRRRGRALDLACGEGRAAVWLAARGWSVTAVDFSGVALQRARRTADRQGAQVDWIQADLVDYRPPAGSFELACVLFLHLPMLQEQAVLQEAYWSLAPGGRLVYLGHDRSNVQHGVGGPRNEALLATPELVLEWLPGAQVLRGEVVVREVAGESGHGTAGQSPARQARDALVVVARPDVAN